MIDWQLVEQNSHLIQEISYSKGRGFKVKMYSRLDALNAAARARAMFKDTMKHEGELSLTVNWDDADDSD